MKGIFSTATFIAIASALVAAAPFNNFAERSASGPIIYTKGADYIHVTSEKYPQTDEASTYGTQTAFIARTQGKDEYASYVSFAIPPLSSISGATESSTCHFVIRNPTNADGSKVTQLYSLGAEFGKTDYMTFWQHPYHDQYYGAYNVAENYESTPVDVTRVPCKFGGKMQFVMRPQNDNDYITWTQGPNVGAYIEIRN
jgi:hypothetical protein